MYEVLEVAGRGRGCFATTSIIEGDIIASFDEFVAVPSFDKKTCVCAQCFLLRDQDHLCLECEDCEVVRYCSERCKVQNKSAHDRLCKIYSALYSIFWKDDSYEASPLRTNAVLAAAALGLSYNFEPLCTLDESVCSPQLCEEFALISKAVEKASGGRHTVAEALQFLQKSECNCFSFWDRRYEQYGAAVCTPASLFNHACAPNAAKIWRRRQRRRLAAVGSDTKEGEDEEEGNGGPQLVFVALCDIEVGEEIFISYIDLSNSVSQRREVLERHFGFICDCSRCQREQEKEEGDKAEEDSEVVCELTDNGQNNDQKRYLQNIMCPCGGVFYLLHQDGQLLQPPSSPEDTTFISADEKVLDGGGRHSFISDDDVGKNTSDSNNKAMVLGGNETRCRFLVCSICETQKSLFSSKSSIHDNNSSNASRRGDTGGRSVSSKNDEEDIAHEEKSLL